MKKSLLVASLLLGFVSASSGAGVLESSIKKMETTGQFDAPLVEFLLSKSPDQGHEASHDALRYRALDVLYGLPARVGGAATQNAAAEARVDQEQVRRQSATVRECVAAFKDFISKRNEASLATFSDVWNALDDSKKEDFLNNLADYAKDDLNSYPNNRDVVSFVTRNPQNFYALFRDLERVSVKVRKINTKSDAVPKVILQKIGNWDVRGEYQLTFSLMILTSKPGDARQYTYREYNVGFSASGDLTLNDIEDDYNRSH